MRCSPTFAGALHPVNPKYDAVDGITSVASLAALTHAPDLAVVVTPARTVSAVLRDAAQAGTRHAVVLTAGFGEIGVAGKALEDDVFGFLF